MASEQEAESFDVLIIGCGMAGLAAGIRLATFDQKVLIVEKHNAPGGLNSFYFQEGRKFDVGLHAVTNFSSGRGRRTPLQKLLRQLRLPPESFALSPQNGSRIAFPGRDLRFANDVSLLESEVAREFPGEVDGFRALRQAVLDFDALDLEKEGPGAREVVGRYIADPVLRDMLFCPLMYYGSSTEHDMPFTQFVTLWRAIFEEGFGRPLEGVRVVIRALLARYRELGGKRRMRCGVRRIVQDGRRAQAVELETGETVTARRILSTIGWPETLLLCGREETDEEIERCTGALSFAEGITVFDRQPAEMGCGETIIFYNDSERFAYEGAKDPIDLRSGVICFPNNYQYPDGGQLPEGLLRVTSIASYPYWTSLEEEAYRREKADWFPRMQKSALRFLPGMQAESLAGATVHTDMFTPRTIRYFTSHLGGAVYGSPVKMRTGETFLDNLYLAGTDQGFLGIIGAMLSGVSMANRHVLSKLAGSG